MFVHFEPEKKMPAPNTPSRVPIRRIPIPSRVHNKKTAKIKIATTPAPAVITTSAASTPMGKINNKNNIMTSEAKPSQSQPFCHEQEVDENEAPSVRRPLTDTMLNQALKESSIDVAEKRIASLTNTAQSIRNNFEQLRVDMRSDYQVQQIEQDLRAVFELTGNYRAEEQELAYRQIQLQKARDVFIKELTNYDAFMATKIDKIGQMNEQFQEYLQKLERFAKSNDNQSMPIKPVMLDKEVQAYPEPTSLVHNSPSIECMSSHIQLPESPVLRTSTIKKKPYSELNGVGVTPRPLYL